MDINGGSQHNKWVYPSKGQEGSMWSFVGNCPKGRGLDKAAVEELKRYRLEIAQNHQGEIFEDSVDLLRQIREDRMRELEQR